MAHSYRGLAMALLIRDEKQRDQKSCGCRCADRELCSAQKGGERQKLARRSEQSTSPLIRAGRR